jgi:hypothetical protein
MTWTEFLIDLLRAHSETLQRLAAFLGENVLVELLEKASDTMDALSCDFVICPEWIQVTEGRGENAAFSASYIELEGAVQEMHLSPVLEFYVWAFPFYRYMIESSIPFDPKFRLPKDKTPWKIL